MRRQVRCRVAEGLFDLRPLEVPHIVQPRAGEIGVGKIGPGEISILEHGTAQIRAGEIGVRRPRVRAGRLSCKLRRMAFGTDRSPGVISRRNSHEEIERQQGERTELWEPGQARILADHRSTPTCQM